MFYNQKRYQGVTLLEIILVLVIAASIVLLSYRQYLSFRRDADIRTLQTNVDILFNAGARFFKANCTRPTFATYYPQQSLAIPITILSGTGYLSQNLTDSPYVSYDSPAASGYVVQFNQFQTGGNLPSRTYDTDRGVRNIGRVVTWSVQVSINLKPGYEALKGPLNADCLSEAGNSGTVKPCASAPANATQFAVFERLPSLVTSGNKSILWYTMPLLKQFKEMYTMDPLSILIDPAQSNQVSSQYYICGT